MSFSQEQKEDVERIIEGVGGGGDVLRMGGKTFKMIIKSYLFEVFGVGNFRDELFD